MITGGRQVLLTGRGTFVGWRLNIWPNRSHGLVLGPSRSGKTASFFLPNILQAATEANRRGRMPASFVVSAPKAELLAVAGPELAAALVTAATKEEATLANAMGILYAAVGRALAAARVDEWAVAQLDENPRTATPSG
jgi:hypothetical protein